MPEPFHVKLAKAGVSKPWLGAQVGRSVSAIEGWCSGRSEPPAEVVAWVDRRLSDPPPKLAPHVPAPPVRAPRKP